MSHTHTDAPPRGSDGYWSRIFETAEAESLDDCTPRLSSLWTDYGWRSTLDVMTEWICAIDFIIPTKAHYRDFTGAVRIGLWNSDHLLDEGYMLTQAVRVANERSAIDGTPVHEEFGSATEVTARLLDNIRLWRPVFDQALRTARAERDRMPVRAHLTRGPGVRERDWWVLRDGAAYLFQVASWPMRAAREMGHPMRPPHMDWLTTDTTVPPHMSLVLSPEGELRHGH